MIRIDTDFRLKNTDSPHEIVACLRFDLSSRSLGHVVFSFAGTAQEAGAGGRSGAAGIPV